MTVKCTQYDSFVTNIFYTDIPEKSGSPLQSPCCYFATPATRAAVAWPGFRIDVVYLPEAPSIRCADFSLHKIHFLSNI